MNRIYNLVWSTVTNSWCCVAETVRTRGKASRAGARSAGAETRWLVGVFFAIPIPLLAAPAATQLPTNGQVVAGQAQISANAPAQLTITQSTDRAAINWQSFNIGSAAKVNFVQPTSQSVTLNRVLGADPSQIFGSLTSNGAVYLSNPNGVLFAPTASVNVGALLATTMGISDADFMAGKATFTRNGSTASVVNQGTLTASNGGYIALLAPEVRNEGIVIANAGTVAMAAGEAITLNFDASSKLLNIAVTPAQIKALVENRRAVIAEGGQIILSARAVETLMGSVVNSGTLDATGITDKGGVVTITADSIELTDSSVIDASGKGTGDGGSVMVWSDPHDARANTIAHGTITAKSGALGGNGGSVETSGHTVDFNGLKVDASAPKGATGTWLVDPYDLTVDSSAASTINTNLATANVTLQTTSSGASGPGTQNAAGNGDIFINSAISWSTANKLTLDAYRNITVNAPISAGNTGKVALITGDTAGNGTGSASGSYSFGLGTSGFGGNLTFGSTASTATLSINGTAYTLLYNTGTTATARADRMT